ncbi:hypothetical protein Tco_0660382 [Tanacetum coccineum]
MGSKEIMPHAVCVPTPVQGHINPMLKLAKILHSKDFLITFVNTEFNHERLIRSQGSDAVCGLPSFHFQTIPDGLSSPQNYDVTQDVPTMVKSVDETALVPFKTAKELNILEILFWTSGVGSLICFDQYPNLLEKGLFPLKDLSDLENGCWIMVVGYAIIQLEMCEHIGGIHVKYLELCRHTIVGWDTQDVGLASGHIRWTYLYEHSLRYFSRKPSESLLVLRLGKTPLRT